MANAFLKECFHSNKNGEIQRNIHGSCSRRICQTCAIGDLVIMRPESTFHHSLLVQQVYSTSRENKNKPVKLVKYGSTISPIYSTELVITLIFRTSVYLNIRGTSYVSTMDVLKPTLIYIDGRCYRINNANFDIFSEKHTGSTWDEESNTYGDSEYLQDECATEEDFEILTTENGRFKTMFHVPRSYYAPVIGTKGVTRKRIEDETKTQIRIPQRQSADEDVVITGTSRSAVASARRRVNMIVMSYRRKHPFTHFISIPMLSQSIKNGFLKFKSLVLETCQSRGVDESIFQNPDKLHLTIATLVLTDNVERNTAADVLQHCKLDVIDPLLKHNPMKLCLSGIEYMNDEPAEVDVLYAKVHLYQGDHFLQELVDGIVNYFSDAGLMDKQYERVKLHVTLMNTLFRESMSGHYSNKNKSRETFNAVPILERFKDFLFGEDIIDEVYISQRYSTSKNGYYQATATVSISFVDKNKSRQD